MMWRYGLGPKSSKMDPNVLIVDQLRPLDILQPSEHNDPALKIAVVAKKGSQAPSVEEDKPDIEEGGL